MRLIYVGDAGSPLLHKWLEWAVSCGDEVHLLSIAPLPRALPGVTLHMIPPRPLVGPMRRLNYLLAAAKVRRLVKRLAPDLIHAHYAWGYGLLAALGRRTTPLVVSVWGTDVLVTARTTALHRMVMRWILSQADAICATGRHLAAITNEFTCSDIVLTPFEVDTEIFRPTERPDRIPVLGMVKRLDANSGVALFLEAVRRLSRDGIDVRAVVVGREPDSRWRQLAAWLGVGERVDFRGHVPAEDMPGIYAEMDVYAQPSRDSEGFGVAVLEAQACGLPAIVSDLGGLPEVIDEGRSGAVFPPGDVAALTGHLRSLVTDSVLRATMGAMGRQFVSSQYGQGAARTRMRAVYESVLPGRR